MQTPFVQVSDAHCALIVQAGKQRCELDVFAKLLHENLRAPFSSPVHVPDTQLPEVHCAKVVHARFILAAFLDGGLDYTYYFQ